MFKNLYGDFASPREVTQNPASRLSIYKSPSGDELKSILKGSSLKEQNSFRTAGRDSEVRFERE